MFSLAPGAKTRDWIGRGADRGPARLATLTNVRGVPYSFPIFGGNSPERWGMLNHGDFYDFRSASGAPGRSRRPPPSPARRRLDAGNFGAAEWTIFKTVALATGAFPVGLRPRQIVRPDTSWFSTNGVVGYDDPTTGTVCQTIRPDANFREAPYAYVSVDGGDDRQRATGAGAPLSFRRHGPAQRSKRRSRQQGGHSHRAFPQLREIAGQEANSGMRLTHLLPRLIGSTLIDQARFKPEELQKASDDTSISPAT